MSKCLCGHHNKFCSGCGRQLDLDQGLLSAVAGHELNFGEFKGKTVGAAVGNGHPDLLNKWARRSGTKGHAQQRLLRAFAKANLAYDELRVASQQAHVFPQQSPRPEVPAVTKTPSPLLALDYDGGTGGTFVSTKKEPPVSWSGWKFSSVKKAVAKIWWFVRAVAFFFFPHTVILQMLGRSRRYVPLIPGVCCLMGVLVLAPRYLGALVFQSFWNFSTGVVIAALCALDESLLSAADMVKSKVQDLGEVMAGAAEEHLHIEANPEAVASAIPPLVAAVLGAMTLYAGPLQGA